MYKPRVNYILGVVTLNVAVEYKSFNILTIFEHYVHCKKIENSLNFSGTRLDYL